MNATSKDLKLLTEAAERAAASSRAAEPDPYRLGFHVQPPTGWLNDPNGLCQKDGVFHAFFQYAPFNADGGLKLWGHAVSRDLLSWEYLPAPLFPDHPFDVNGAYSGSALVEDGRLELFYTGNVKREDGDGFDYVTTGREAAVIRACYNEATGLVDTKRVVLTNTDYPADDTLHVRDPKVWRLACAEAERAAKAGVGPYLMVLGARRRGDLPESTDQGGDAGEVLVFSSADKRVWTLANRVSTPKRFGFMWECPDYFELPAAPAVKILSVSPQGLSGAPWDALNVYQAGYFTVAGDVWDAAHPCAFGDFSLWDAGFDFYAPQSFEAEDGRRILVAWMGIPDEPAYGNDPTVARGWQHALTVPREVTVAADGSVRTWPVREVEALRGSLDEGGDVFSAEGEPACLFDLEVAPQPGEQRLQGFYALVADELELSYNPDAQAFTLRFTDPSRASAGCGRTERTSPVGELEDVRVLADTSSVEVFVNGGAAAFTTRIYPKRVSVNVEAPGARISFWPLKA